MRILLLAVCALILGAPALADKRITLESLLREMVDRDAIARLPDPPYACKQASSYDRRSKTPDDKEGWFANQDWSQFIRSEVNHGRREWVMMDAEGPGAVVRIWWGGLMPPKERRIRFYLDGADEPAIEGPAYEILAGGLLAPKPLSIENAHGGPPGAPGGMNLFLPIPYAKHCKITWDDVNPKDPLAPPDSRWYNIEYRTYPAGTPVESFTSEKLKGARRLVEQVCAELSSPRPIKSETPSGFGKRLAPGEEAALDLRSGPAAVRRIELSVTPEFGSLEQALRSTVIRIHFDGQETVWCPAGDFFGSGAGLNRHESWYRSVSAGGTMACRWVMPYQRSARITLLNRGTAGVNVKLAAWATTWRWDEWSMHFHCDFRRDDYLPTRPFSDWNYLTSTGQGVYLGDTLTVFNPVPDWWGEGDEKIYVDGETFPSHFGTGSEDYYGYSWGNTTLFQGPFSNQVRCDGPGNKGYTVVTRTRSLDAIPFTKSLKFDMEVWHWADCKVGYAVASYWYARPGASRVGQGERGRGGETVALRQVPPPLKIAGAFECEGMQVLAKSPGLVAERQDGGLSEGEWSGGAHLFVRGQKVGDFIELSVDPSKSDFYIPPPPGARYQLTLYATKSWDYGILRFTVNGEPAVPAFDAYHKPAVASGPIDLGVHAPVNGRFVLRAEVVGANPKAEGSKAYFGLDCVAILPPSPLPVRDGEPLPEALRGVKRLLVLGDSITYAGGYVEELETALRVRYPNERIEIIDLGLPSETVSGLSEPGHAGGAFPRPCLHERLERALDLVKPDMVIACYGMNDGIYYPFGEERFAAFKQGILKLSKAVKSHGAKLWLLTPPPFDPNPIRASTLPAGLAEYRQPYVDYDDVLARYGAWELANQNEGWRAVDVHTHVRAYLDAQRAKDPSFALAGDGVHLNGTGHHLIAEALVRALGLPPNATEGASPELKRLVHERQSLLKDAWLTAVGHKRPGMNRGLPLPEAEAKAKELDEKIRALASQK